MSNKAAKFAKHSDLRLELKLKVKAVPMLGARNNAIHNLKVIEGMERSPKMCSLLLFCFTMTCADWPETKKIGTEI